MIGKLFSLFSHDIGIDLGTANTLVWVRGKGVVIREPSVVAMQKKTKKIIAIGTEAKRMVGKTPAAIVTVKPLRGGVISDFDATAAMIAHYIQQVHEVGSFLPLSIARPRVAIGIPSSVTEVERRAVWEAAMLAGARQAFLIEEPMAAAIGEGISVFAPTGAMIVDIGGGTTEIAIISLGGIVVSRSLRLAGDEMDQAIIHYIRLRHGILLGESTAEELKMKIGSAYDVKSKVKNPASPASSVASQRLASTLARGEQKSNVGEVKHEATSQNSDRMAIVRGRDIETGLPRSLRVTEVEVREALAPVIARIVEGIVETLEEAPPELTADILKNGIFLTGGGASLLGIDRLIVEHTHMSVVLSEEPLLSVVRGTGRVLEDPSLLHRVKVTGGLS